MKQLPENPKTGKGEEYFELAAKLVSSRKPLTIIRALIQRDMENDWSVEIPEDILNLWQRFVSTRYIDLYK